MTSLHQVSILRSLQYESEYRLVHICVPWHKISAFNRIGARRSLWLTSTSWIDNLAMALASNFIWWGHQVTTRFSNFQRHTQCTPLTGHTGYITRGPGVPVKALVPGTNWNKPLMHHEILGPKSSATKTNQLLCYNAKVLHRKLACTDKIRSSLKN